MTQTSSFFVTEQAWEHLAEHVPSPYLFISLKVSGCSGYAYEFEPLESLPDQECYHIIEKTCQVQVLVPKTNFDKFFKKAKLDLKKSTFGTQLFIDNPNIKDSCGCGQSFTFEGSETHGTTER